VHRFFYTVAQPGAGLRMLLWTYPATSRIVTQGTEKEPDTRARYLSIPPPLPRHKFARNTDSIKAIRFGGWPFQHPEKSSRCVSIRDKCNFPGSAVTFGLVTDGAENKPDNLAQFSPLQLDWCRNAFSIWHLNTDPVTGRTRFLPGLPNGECNAQL
jgi:hypothetical protein